MYIGSRTFKNIYPHLQRSINELAQWFQTWRIEVYLHQPTDLPRPGTHYYPVQNEQTTPLAIGLRVITVSEKLKDYTSETNFVIFKNTRGATAKSNVGLTTPLRSAAACGSTCPAHNNSQQICCFSDRQCIVEAQEELAARERQLTLKTAAGHAAGEGCRCLPGCHYDAKVLESDFLNKRMEAFYALKFNKTWEVRRERLISICITVTSTAKTLRERLLRRLPGKRNTNRLSKLLEYFKNDQFTTITRSELFCRTDFLANCEGLLGLFLGFSFLSIVETIYYSSLRQISWKC
ncbi:Pickpocket protein 28 [Eumeta japonica]|uniref:Pickpocket protein 28 n=1 Tax=Eumeta variegata TaxID=151549 RepID=A0A4C1VVL7_EUMVA|nr:Pickpocket protein 28 [Eumeta japonica]